MTQSCCPSCGSEDLRRIKRGFLVKLFLPWFDFRHFYCECCLKTHYQWPYGLFAPRIKYLPVASIGQVSFNTPPLSNTFIPYHLDQAEDGLATQRGLDELKKIEEENNLLKARLSELQLYNKLLRSEIVEKA